MQKYLIILLILLSCADINRTGKSKLSLLNGKNTNFAFDNDKNKTLSDSKILGDAISGRETYNQTLLSGTVSLEKGSLVIPIKKGVVTLVKGNKEIKSARLSFDGVFHLNGYFSNGLYFLYFKNDNISGYKKISVDSFSQENLDIVIKEN